MSTEPRTAPTYEECLNLLGVERLPGCEKESVRQGLIRWMWSILEQDGKEHIREDRQSLLDRWDYILSKKARQEVQS
ncbi:MAG: hypothetical protein C4576_19775 [Desulfobacteraceae bacterium]|nr:MAG: hypothetical protein C4576_19775 [Desulfobacteraceae bacterium]